MAAIDKFSSRSGGVDSPGSDIFEITPHDTNELAFATRGICFGTAGDLRVMTLDGRDIVIPEGVLVAGVIHPLRVRMVYSTNTTATDIYGVT